ncbi:GYF-like_domain superfamily [Hexamita inflata]|uniref:GYF-like domain superfamily n=1 Tax=Hexamita inflata TaxID=28002 RepID=A0AA86QIC4_9EUKA|nr:GYF-like domain superfamily [Hexamita inflata]
MSYSDSESQSTNNQFPAENPVEVIPDKNPRPNVNMWEYLDSKGQYKGPFNNYDMDIMNQNGDFKNMGITQVKCGKFRIELKKEDYGKADFFENIEVEDQADQENNPQPQYPSKNHNPNKYDPYDNLQSNYKFQEESESNVSDSNQSVVNVIMEAFNNKTVQTGMNTVQNDQVFQLQVTNAANCDKQTQVEAINKDLVFTKNNIRYEKILTKETLIKNALPKFKELILEAINGFFKITPKFLAFETESLKNALKFYKWYNSEVQIINLDLKAIAAQLNLTETDISSMFRKLQCEQAQYNEEKAIYNLLNQNFKQILSNKIIQLWQKHQQLSIDDRKTIIQDFIQLQFKYTKLCNSAEQKKIVEQQDAIFQQYKYNFVKNDIEQLFQSLSVSPSREKLINTELQQRRLKQDEQFVDYNFNIQRDVQAVEVGDHAGVRVPIIKKEQKDQKESIFAPGANLNHSLNTDLNPEKQKNETEKPKIDKAHDYFTDPNNPDVYSQCQGIDLENSKEDNAREQIFIFHPENQNPFDFDYWHFDDVNQPYYNNNQQNNPVPNYPEQNQINRQYFIEQRDEPQNNLQQDQQQLNNQPVQKNAENHQQQSIDTNAEQNTKNVQNTEQNTIDTKPGTEKTTKWSQCEQEQLKQIILKQINQNSKYERKFDAFDELVEYLKKEKEQQIIKLSHINFQEVAKECGQPENECKQKLLTLIGKDQYKNLAMSEFKEWLLPTINNFLQNKRDFVRHPQSEDLINDPLKEALINHQKYLSEGKSVHMGNNDIAKQLGLTEDDISNMIRTQKDNQLYEWPADIVFEIKTRADQLWQASQQQHPEFSNQDRKKQVMKQLNLDQYKQQYWCSPKNLSNAMNYYLNTKFQHPRNE